MKRKSAIIIGAGFGGLGTACLLGKAGWDVTIFEKNEQVGGRAGSFETHGFRFDTGPSWYLMSEVFERFFKLLGEKTTDHLDLQKLSPSYRVFFKGTGEQIDIHSDLTRDFETFESIETGAGNQLKRYLAKAEYIHSVAMKDLLYKNYRSPLDFLTPRLLSQASKLNLLSNLQNDVVKYFNHPHLQQILEYPAVFLGASPYSIPAFYGLLNHVLFNQGVFYPEGGMYKVTESLAQIARKHGARIRLNSSVGKIIIEGGQAAGAVVNGKVFWADAVISNADPYHTETALIDAKHRDHSEKYWLSRTLAPSALLIYLGVGRQYENLDHHNLVFSQAWQKNFNQIFGSAQFPDDPSFYVCAPSKTDPSAAPKGKENMFVLVPLQAGLTYTARQLEAYSNQVLKTMETELPLESLRNEVEFKKLFAVKDFESRFNSFKGTGLGLAHTLKQTAVFRPANQSKKVKNLYFVGAHTHPGIGLPATLISAQLVTEVLVADQPE